MSDIQTVPGWNEQLMFSSLTAEATYGAAVTVNASNFQSFNGFSMPPAVEDKVVNDLDEVTGSEVATSQETIEQRKKLPYSQPKATPNAVAFLLAAVLGNVTDTQDGALDAYSHYIKPETVGTALASFNAIHKRAGLQKIYKGCKGTSIKITSEQEGIIAVEAEIITNGAAATDASSFVSKVSETWLKANDTKVYIKTSPDPATDIIAAGSMSQASDNISSAQNLTSIGARVRSWSIEANNNVEPIAGHGGGGTLQDVDYNRRTYTLSMSLLFADGTELGYFENDTPLAVEFNCKDDGAGVIAATGAMYYGLIVRIPKCRIKKRPEPAGGPNDPHTLDLEFEILDDGTNPPVDFMVYNAIAAYLA